MSVGMLDKWRSHVVANAICLASRKLVEKHSKRSIERLKPHRSREAGTGVLLLVLGVSLSSWTVLADTVPGFVLRWGTQGIGPGQFLSPLGIGVDPQGNVYVADTDNHRVQKFSGDSTFIASWSGAGRPGGGQIFPSDVAVDPSGVVYVSDVGRPAIIRLDASLNYIDEWPVDHAHTQIAIDPTGQYLYGTYAPLIYQYTTSGTFIRSWFTRDDPDRDANWGIACGSSGNVYVAMESPHVVRVFTSEGTFLREWGGLGTGNGQLSSPLGVAVSPTENVYVTDSQYRVQIFTSSGAFDGTWGSEGYGDNQFIVPDDVTIDANGAVYVLDSHGIVRKFAGGIVPVHETSWGRIKLRYR